MPRGKERPLRLAPFVCFAHPAGIDPSPRRCGGGALLAEVFEDRQIRVPSPCRHAGAGSPLRERQSKKSNELRQVSSERLEKAPVPPRHPCRSIGGRTPRTPPGTAVLPALGVSIVSLSRCISRTHPSHRFTSRHPRAGPRGLPFHYTGSFPSRAIARRSACVGGRSPVGRPLAHRSGLGLMSSFPRSAFGLGFARRIARMMAKLNRAEARDACYPVAIRRDLPVLRFGPRGTDSWGSRSRVGQRAPHSMRSPLNATR